MGYETIVVPLASTAGTIGGVWANKISQLLSGVDVSATDATNQPLIGTPTKFMYQALRIRDSPNAKSVIFQGPGALDVDKTILIPTMPVGLNTDTLLLLSSNQSPTNKIFNLASNLLTETGQALGAILKHDGVEYTGLPRGTVNQVLTSTGTDVAWASITPAQLPATLLYNNVANTHLETLTINKTAQAGISEQILTLTVSDDTVGYFRLQNTSPTNAVFSPGIYGKSGGNNTSFFFLAETTPANDNGTNPLMIIDCRRDDNTVVQTRPLLTFRNSSGSAYFQINASNQVSTSPAWAAALIINNNLPLQTKSSGGTLLNTVRVSSGDVLVLGTSTVQLLGTQIFAGNASVAIDIGNTNFITFNKLAVAGVAETLATWKVSDDTSSFSIANTSAADNIFSPRFTSIASLATGTSISAHYWQNVIDVANDVGNQPVWLIDARRSDATDVVARPLFEFRNRSTAVFKINAKGDIVNTAIATTGVAEPIAKFTVSDDTGAQILFINGIATDGIFTPMVKYSLSANSTTAHVALWQFHEIVAANDGGVNPVAIFAARTTAFGDIGTRPTFDFRNNAISLFKINAKGDVIHSIIPQSGVAEVLFEIKKTDCNSYIRLQNNTTVDGNFAPGIKGRQVEVATVEALRVSGTIEVAHDTGAVPAMIFSTELQGGTDLAVRPLYEFRNRSTGVLQIDATGRSIFTAMARTGIAEVVAKFTVFDNNASYMEIRNALSADAQFATHLVTYLGSSLPVTARSFIHSCYISSVSDSGTVAAWALSCKKSDETAITVRPLVNIYNAGTEIFELTAKGTQVAVIISGTGDAEVLYDGRVSDSTANYVQIKSFTATDGDFVPGFFSRAKTQQFAGWYQYAQIDPLDDIAGNSNGIMVFDGRNADSTPIAVRPNMFQFRNNGGNILTIGRSNLTFADACDILFSGTTGTKIGTTISQKIGFWGAAPVVRPAANPDTTGATLAALETEVNELKALLRTVGLMA
jgi:hypothetical protein